jgi:hypothetical protein
MSQSHHRVHVKLGCVVDVADGGAYRITYAIKVTVSVLYWYEKPPNKQLSLVFQRWLLFLPLFSVWQEIAMVFLCVCVCVTCVGCSALCYGQKQRDYELCCRNRSHLDYKQHSLCVCGLLYGFNGLQAE